MLNSMSANILDNVGLTIEQVQARREANKSLVTRMDEFMMREAIGKSIDEVGLSKTIESLGRISSKGKNVGDMPEQYVVKSRPLRRNILSLSIEVINNESCLGE